MIAGKNTIIEASAVPQIAEPLQSVNTLPAHELLKDEFPDDTIIKDAQIQSSSGGQIDLLLGIKYLSLFPKNIRISREGNLGLFKLTLLPYEEDKDCCVGGSYAKNN